MKVLVVGGGGREHALVWKISQSESVDEVIAAPGNDGMMSSARCVPVSAEDIDGQLQLADKEKPDLVVIGPEAPLTEGLADRLTQKGYLVFGPSAAAAQLEGSKVFAKQFMERNNIPTAAFSVHEDIDSAEAEIERRNGPCVVKADGLAAGKGVIVCENPLEAKRAVREMLVNNRFGGAGKRVIIEDLIRGEEASVLAICDGERFLPLVAAQDHKAVFEGDRGPNTGGMGAYAPAPVVTEELQQKVVSRVLEPTIKNMASEGTPFKGILYAGLMIIDDEPSVLEFNVRFGDPECQPLLCLLGEDLTPLLVSAAKGNLTQDKVQWKDGATMCVVLASGGYPGSYDKGARISGIEAASSDPSVVVFHAGTKLNGNDFVTAGGRVLGVTAFGPSLKEAADAAYDACDKISWKEMHMRRDIGYRAL